MKTQVIVLESHDDLVSVKDRMSWAKSPRILLVWPVGENIALRPLDLKILERHARSLGAALGLVTRDSRVRREAAARKLPVFNSPRAAQSGHWPVQEKPGYRSSRTTADLHQMRDAAHPMRIPWQEFPMVRFGAFTLAVAAVLMLASLFLPHAEIILRPESRIQSLEIPVTADSSLASVLITGGVPAYDVTYEVTGTSQLASTGEEAVPVTEARGVARFRNLTSSKILIPLGTIVHTLGASPVKFETTQQAEIAAGVGKIVDVPIEAVGAGAGGNLGVDMIQVIEGPLSVSLAVTNPAPASGGTERFVPAPSMEDRERLRALLMENLRTQMQLELLAALPLGSIIFPDTVKEVAVLEETPEPPVGKTGALLSLALRVKFSTLYASGEDLSNLATMALSASLENGFTPTTTGSATFKIVGKPVTDDTGRTEFKLHMERIIRRDVDTTRIFSLVQGKSVESATSILNRLVILSAPAQIEVNPSWWQWLPLVPFRMNIIIQ